MPANINDRNVALFEAVLCGTTCKSAGDRFGVSRERVRQVCRRLVRQLRQASPVEDVIPEHNWLELDELRAHKDFWMRRLEKLRASQCADLA